MNNNSNLFRKCETMLFSISDIFGINNDDMSISEPVYFRIPKYQRSYVWEQGTYDFSQEEPKALKKNKRFKGQLEYFWEDLNNTINNEKHYTGLIGLKKMSEKEKTREDIPEESLAFYVIDGQQRFTTIMLLISAINKDKNLDKIILDRDSRLLFDYTIEKKNYREILKSVLFNRNCDKTHNYKEKLTNAKSFFVSMLKKTNGNIDDLKNALLNNILFNVFFSVGSDEDCNNKMSIAPEIIFESINNRGKELSKIDILKNRIFYLDKQKMIDKGIVDDIESDWTTIFDNLSSIKSLQVKDDDYLLTHYYIFGNDSNIKVKTTILLQSILDIFQINEKIDKRQISEYFKTLRDCSKYWLWINNPKEINVEQLQEKLTANCKYSLINIISKLSHLVDSNYVKSLIILLIYSYNDLKYITINKLISILIFFEKYIFIYQFLNYRNLDLPYIATKTKNLLFNEKGEYRNRDDFNNQLQKMSNELKEDIKDILDTEHLKLWANRMMSKDTCFYSWNGIYYTLYELNNSLSEDGKIEWQDIIVNKSKTIEHIYPENANGKNNDSLSIQYWEAACPSSLLEQKNKMIHSLGNLVPISQENNSSASNKLYPIKLKTYEKGSSMTMSLQNKFKTDIYWDIKLVKDRTKSLFEDIQDRWLKNNEEEYNFNYTIDETVLTILTNFNEKQDDNNYLERRKDMKKIWNEYNSKYLCDKIYNKIKERRQNDYNYSDKLYSKDFCSQNFNLDYPVLSNNKDEKYFNIFRNKIFLLNLENYDNSIKEKILEFLH